MKRKIENLSRYTPVMAGALKPNRKRFDGLLNDAVFEFETLDHNNKNIGGILADIDNEYGSCEDIVTEQNRVLSDYEDLTGDLIDFVISLIEMKKHQYSIILIQNDSLYKVVDWLRDNTDGDYSFLRLGSFAVIVFDIDADMVLFDLTFPEEIEA